MACSVASSSVGVGSPSSTNFIKQIVEEDLKQKPGAIVTRFPPEPNGFLHLGHAKSICLNFGLARSYDGQCHLRFDDTNPEKEEMRYIESIKEDVRWLGGVWGSNEFYASDYFQQLYEWAELLITKGLAYVDHQTGEEIRRTRGSITAPGIDSPFRERTVEENMDLFRKMRAGELADGACVLRAKIDMRHGNLNMRDPLLYRILKASHPRTKAAWCIYPMYDFAHGQSDSIEKITHSICTLEFELHRPLYNWFQEKLEIFRTRQIEFARLNLTYTVMSKRKLLCLVKEGFVKDWDDPRMPTIAGMRRRGVPSAAICDFCGRIGVAKRENVIQVELFELCVREHMHRESFRRLAILRPLLVTISNFEAAEEAIEAANHPERPELGTRTLHFGRRLFIDRADFQEKPEPNFYRLAPGREVRLRYAYWIKCDQVIRGADGEVCELRCSYDRTTKGGNAPEDGRKVKGTIHWLAEADATPAEFRLYERLFTKPNPEAQEDEEEEATKEGAGDKREAAVSSLAASMDSTVSRTSSWRDCVNPNSLSTVQGCVEAAACGSLPGVPLQFERLGFFTADLDSTPNLPVFNRTVTLADAVTAGASAAAADAQANSKQADKLARAKAAAERKAMKEERERRKEAKAATADKEHK
eukprot:GHVT01010064.1.p1 GENE.GHVT01010064.1~~GHVT01010064.1.p1  ORF type:complete len:644 (+),score=148.33 GHVT01010064.1:144-2075(+)